MASLCCLALVAAGLVVYQLHAPALLSPSPEIAPAGKGNQGIIANWYGIARFKKIKGVALVIHGLNLKPEKMEDIVSVLNQGGIEVLNLSLHGHGGNYVTRAAKSQAEERLASFCSVTYELWSAEVYRGYQQVRQLAERKKIPLFFVGYSLGGLLGCDLLVSHPEVAFERMVLFAPALNVTIESYLLKALSPFPALIIDSLSPKSYRSNDGTPVAAYKALFTAIEHFESNFRPQLNVPAVVFIDAEDEFISCQRLQELVARQKLDKWMIRQIRKDQDAGLGTAHHLLIDEDSVGRRSWTQIRDTMLEHLCR